MTKGSNKKICFVVSSPITAQAFLINHIRVLSDHYDVYLVANFDGFDTTVLKNTEIKEMHHIAIHRNIKLWSDFVSLLKMIKYFKTMKFDAVHTVTPKAGLVGIIASKLGGIRVRIHIFTGQVWHTKKGIFKKFLKFLDKIIVFNATKILVDGESQRRFLINEGIIKNSNSVVLGKGSISGVNTSKFVPDHETREEIRKKLGIKNDEIVIMFLGRMNIDKGIRELTDAFKILNQKFPTLKLLLVGGDEQNMTSYIKNKISNLDQVILYGSTPTPEKYIQACDIFSLPSHREGFGTSVIEASLLEKPIVCSDTYGLQETIIENKTGLRHKVGDVNSLVVQLDTLISSKEHRVELGKNGREYVLNNFSADMISFAWLQFYLKEL